MTYMVVYERDFNRISHFGNSYIRFNSNRNNRRLNVRWRIWDCTKQMQRWKDGFMLGESGMITCIYFPHAGGIAFLSFFKQQNKNRHSSDLLKVFSLLHCVKIKFHCMCFLRLNLFQETRLYCLVEVLEFRPNLSVL